MEIGVIGNSSGYELTEEARHLVEQIVVLDSASRADKELLFEQLYQLWRQDLVIGVKAETKFSKNEGFIKETILNSFPAEERESIINAEKTYEVIKERINYTTADNKTIICNDETIRNFRKRVYYSRDKIKGRFTSLLGEFQEYIKNKRNYISDSILYAPNTPRAPTRESLGRLAKDQALLIIEGYAGTASSSNPDGKKRKRGKKENADGTGESDESEVNNTL
jgi:hypothetical protein